MTKDTPRMRGSAAVAAAAAALLAVAAAGFLSSCLPDHLAAYRDSAQNLILGKGLSTGTIDLSLAAYQSPGTWTWSWRGTSDADTYNYMDLVAQPLEVPPTTTSGPSTLSPSSPVYLLRLNNLIPDADFEAQPLGPLVDPNWGASASTNKPVPLSIINAASTPLHGRWLNLDLDSSQGAYFKFGALLDRATTTTDHSYTWICNFLSADLLPYRTGDFGAFTINPLDPDLSAVGLSEQRIGNLINTFATISTNSLVFGSTSPATATMDDIRILRTAITGNYSLRMLLRPSDTSPALIPGFYEFSVWVKKSAASSYSTDAAAKSPYASRKVTLSMTELSPLPFQGPSQAFDVTPSSTTGNDASAGWTRLAFYPGINFTGAQGVFPDQAAQVLELEISPADIATGPSKVDAGEILIAQPELRVYINGR